MSERASAPDMLDDPGISRQWVLRRLQKVLTGDLAIAALLDGMRRTVRQEHVAALRFAAEAMAERARLGHELIEQEGGTPYSSVGLARAASRLGGRILGLAGPRLWRPLLGRLLEQSCADLDGLVDLARGAPGVSEQVAERMAGEIERCREVRRRLVAS